MKQWWKRQDLVIKSLVIMGGLGVGLGLLVLLQTLTAENAKQTNTADDTTEYWGTISTIVTFWHVTTTDASATIVADNSAPRAGGALSCTVNFTTPSGVVVASESGVNFNVPAGENDTQEVSATVTTKAKDLDKAIPQLDCQYSVSP